MKRIRMGGAADVVTDDAVAELVLEYARELGRVSTTDTVGVPAALESQAVTTDLLLGPASQISVSPVLDGTGSDVDLPGLEDVRADLQRRLDRLRDHGRSNPPSPETAEAFTDFDQYGIDT